MAVQGAASQLHQKKLESAQVNIKTHKSNMVEDASGNMRSFKSSTEQQVYERANKTKQVMDDPKKAMFFKDAKIFLHMMMAQLQNQNPNKPFDTNQFTQQMAMFAQTEQAIAMGEKMGKVASGLERMQNMQGSDMVGKIAEVDMSTETAATSGAILRFQYQLAGEANDVRVTIYGHDGSKLEEQQLVPEGGRPLMAGSNHYVYRAFDANGKPLPHGEYRAFIEATNTKIDVDENGNKTRTKDIVPVQQKIAQPIKAYISSLDGADPMVELKNGMQIPIDRVKKVIANDLNQAQAAAEQPTDPRKSMNALQWEKWGRAKFEQEQAEQKAQAAATQPAN